MSDLIDRQSAIDALHMHLMYRMGTDSNKKRLDDWINGVPSVQPEIIRCKDCKYYVVHTMFGRSAGWCERDCDENDKLLAHVTELDDFCSRAERRTG